MSSQSKGIGSADISAGVCQAKRYSLMERSLRSSSPFDLNSGRANGTWTNPATAAVETVSIKLELNRIAHNSTFGNYYIFNSDNPADEMGYLITFTLL